MPAGISEDDRETMRHKLLIEWAFLQLRIYSVLRNEIRIFIHWRLQLKLDVNGVYCHVWGKDLCLLFQPKNHFGVLLKSICDIHTSFSRSDIKSKVRRMVVQVPTHSFDILLHLLWLVVLIKIIILIDNVNHGAEWNHNNQQKHINEVLKDA